MVRKFVLKSFTKISNNNRSNEADYGLIIVLFLIQVVNTKHKGRRHLLIKVVRYDRSTMHEKNFFCYGDSNSGLHIKFKSLNRYSDAWPKQSE